MDSFVVPLGVDTIVIHTWGAQGGEVADRLDNSDGGMGGYATGKYAVVQGQVFYVFVGGQGFSNGSGGWNGGGNGGSSIAGGSCFGGPASGGGGAADVRFGGIDNGHRIIVAGGGGAVDGSGVAGGGGGGGSSYIGGVLFGSTISGVRSGNGMVVLEYSIDTSCATISINTKTDPSPGQSNGSIDLNVSGSNIIRYCRWSTKVGVNYPTGSDFDLTNAPQGTYYLLYVTGDNEICYKGPFNLGTP